MQQNCFNSGITGVCVHYALIVPWSQRCKIGASTSFLILVKYEYTVCCILPAENRLQVNYATDCKQLLDCSNLSKVISYPCLAHYLAQIGTRFCISVHFHGCWVRLACCNHKKTLKQGWTFNSMTMTSSMQRRNVSECNSNPERSRPPSSAPMAAFSIMCTPNSGTCLC